MKWSMKKQQSSISFTCFVSTGVMRERPVTKMTAATAAMGGRDVREGVQMVKSSEGFEHSALPKTITYVACTLCVKTGRGRGRCKKNLGIYSVLSVCSGKSGRSDRKARASSMINETRGGRENNCQTPPNETLF